MRPELREQLRRRKARPKRTNWWPFNKSPITVPLTVGQRRAAFRRLYDELSKPRTSPTMIIASTDFHDAWNDAVLASSAVERNE